MDTSPEQQTMNLGFDPDKVFEAALRLKRRGLENGPALEAALAEFGTSKQKDSSIYMDLLLRMEPEVRKRKKEKFPKKAIESDQY